MNARLYTRLVSLLLVVATGCATTHSGLVNLWVDTRQPPEPAERVLVVALWRTPDARAMWEERFVEVLESNDAAATPSYLELSGSVPDSVAVFREARRAECDRVIVIHEHVLDQDTFYIPGYSRPREEKKPVWFRSTGGSEVWMAESGGGWPALHCDVEMWSVREKAAMVWSGTSEVVDPGDDEHAAYASARTVTNELSRLGLISSRL
jgi:hypothetical protein